VLSRYPLYVFYIISFYALSFYCGCVIQHPMLAILNKPLIDWLIGSLLWHCKLTVYSQIYSVSCLSYSSIYYHILAIINVFALPPRLSLRSHVSAESRYGMYICRWRRDDQSLLERFTSMLLSYDHEHVSHDCMIDFWAVC